MRFRNTKTKLSRYFRIFAWSALALYLAVLTKMILFKNPETSVKILRKFGFAQFQANLADSNFVPFRTIYYHLAGRQRLEFVAQNMLGNLIGFMPLGFLLPVLFPKLRETKKIILVTFLTSLAFEIVQLITNLGSFDVDDLLLNTIGGFLGYCLFVLFKLFFERR